MHQARGRGLKRNALGLPLLGHLVHWEGGPRIFAEACYPGTRSQLWRFCPEDHVNQGRVALKLSTYSQNKSLESPKRVSKRSARRPSHYVLSHSQMPAMAKTRLVPAPREHRVPSIMDGAHIGSLCTTWTKTRAATINLPTICVRNMPSPQRNCEYFKTRQEHHAFEMRRLHGAASATLCMHKHKVTLHAPETPRKSRPHLFLPQRLSWQVNVTPVHRKHQFRLRPVGQALRIHKME